MKLALFHIFRGLRELNVSEIYPNKAILLIFDWNKVPQIVFDFIIC